MSRDVHSTLCPDRLPRRLLLGEAKAGSDVSEVRWVQEDELAAMGLRGSIEQVVRKGFRRVKQNIS